MKSEVVYGAKRGAGKTREMVLRYHLQGMTDAQIAKKAGISRQAVGQHIQRLKNDGEIQPTQR